MSDSAANSPLGPSLPAEAWSLCGGGVGSALGFPLDRAGEYGSGGALSHPWRSQRVRAGARGGEWGERKGGREEGEGKWLWPASPVAEGEQTLLSRLLGPFPFDPPSLAAPMLTLGLILFPTWAGTPGAGRRAPGVTNARPRPGLPPPRSCSQLFIKSMCVPLAPPGAGAGAGPCPGPLWKHSGAHV